METGVAKQERLRLCRWPGLDARHHLKVKENKQLRVLILQAPAARAIGMKGATREGAATGER
jgi:hypothetical protein